MKVKVIPTEMGVVLESSFPVEQSTINKLNNPLNANKIKNHLAEIGCEQEIRVNDKKTDHVLKINIYRECTDKEFTTAMKSLERNHVEFLENVNLRMPEVQPVEHQQDAPSTSEEDKSFNEEMLKGAAEILKDMEMIKLEDDDALIIGTFSPIGIGLGVGVVKVELIREALDCFIDKHLQK